MHSIGQTIITRGHSKALITAPDRTQLNSTQLVELSPIGRCDQGLEILNFFRLTRLTENWTISVGLSCKSDHIARRDVITLRTQLNSTAS